MCDCESETFQFYEKPHKLQVLFCSLWNSTTGKKNQGGCFLQQCGRSTWNFAIHHVHIFKDFLFWPPNILLALIVERNQHKKKGQMQPSAFPWLTFSLSPLYHPSRWPFFLTLPILLIPFCLFFILTFTILALSLFPFGYQIHTGLFWVCESGLYRERSDGNVLCMALCIREPLTPDVTSAISLTSDLFVGCISGEFT